MYAYRSVCWKAYACRPLKRRRTWFVALRRLSATGIYVPERDERWERPANTRHSLSFASEQAPRNASEEWIPSFGRRCGAPSHPRRRLELVVFRKRVVFKCRMGTIESVLESHGPRESFELWIVRIGLETTELQRTKRASRHRTLGRGEVRGGLSLSLSLSLPDA